MMRYDNLDTSLTMRDGAPSVVDGTKAGGVLWHVVASQGADETVEFLSHVGDRAPLPVANKTVDFFCKRGELTRDVRSADLILAGRVGQLHLLPDVGRASSEQANISRRAVRLAAGSARRGTLSTLSKKRRAAFDPAPLARGGRKPRQSKQGAVG